MHALSKEVISQDPYQAGQQLVDTFSSIAYLCAVMWNDTSALDKLLFYQQSNIPHCKMLYVIDKYGIQISANISSQNIDSCKRGQYLKNRPYMQEMNTSDKFHLSSVYLSQTGCCRCITATHQIMANQEDQLGYLAADFDVSNLPDAQIF